MTSQAEDGVERRLAVVSVVVHNQATSLSLGLQCQ